MTAGHIVGDPFALATISIACVCVYSIPWRKDKLTDLGLQLAWLITFIASIIAARRGDFPNFAWWAIAYIFCTLVGMFIVVGSNSTHTYHVAVSHPLCIVHSQALMYLTGCWFPGRGPHIRHSHCEHIGILYRPSQRGLRSRLHSPIHGYGMHAKPQKYQIDPTR